MLSYKATNKNKQKRKIGYKKRVSYITYPKRKTKPNNKTRS